MWRRWPGELPPGDCQKPFGHAFAGLRRHDRQDLPLSTRNLDGRYLGRTALLPALYEHWPDYYHQQLTRVSLELHKHYRQEMLHAKHSLGDKCPARKEVQRGLSSILDPLQDSL